MSTTTRAARTGEVNVKDVAKITDVPRGAGAKGIGPYEKQMARASAAAGQICGRARRRIKPPPAIPIKEKILIGLAS